MHQAVNIMYVLNISIQVLDAMIINVAVCFELFCSHVFICWEVRPSNRTDPSLCHTMTHLGVDYHAVKIKNTMVTLC